MLRLILIIVGICCILNNGRAQYAYGAKAGSLAYATVALSDSWAGLVNPAGITNVSRTTIGASYESPTLVQGISSSNFITVIPSQLLHTAIGIQNFGFDAYKEQRLSVAFAKRYHHLFAYGITANYHRLNITNYGISSAYSTDAGLHYFLAKTLTLGIAVSNFGLTKLQGQALGSTFSGFKTGLAWCFFEQGILYAQFEKQMNNKYPIGRLAIAYTLLPSLDIRVGLQSNPSIYYAGIGYYYNHWQIDFASSFQSYLGVMGYYPQSSIAYAF